MKTLLGYTVWNKRDMIAWLLHGIQLNFDPAQTDVVFHFDACMDGSQDAFNSSYPFFLLSHGWKPEQVRALASPVEIRELGAHNSILDLFLTENYDMCLIAQDDQRFMAGPAKPLEMLLAKYGSRLGIVGGRDGYGIGYSNFTGSLWSESSVQRRVNHGEFVPLPHINTGPVAYTQAVVKKVGKLDPEFIAYYAFDDYGQRSVNCGFVNGVMGMDMVHGKFGQCLASTPEFIAASAHDLALRQRKHGF